MATQNEIKQSQVVVVMVPFPAQGHLNQLLHLSRLISSYDIPIHFISTTTHIRQAKLRIHGWDPLSTSNIHFHEFQTSHFPPPPPLPSTSVRFPSHLLPSWEASSHLGEPFAKLLLSLSPTANRIVVIHDYLMSSVVQDVVSTPNAEAYSFQACSAFTLLCNHWEARGSSNLEVESKLLLEGIPSGDGSLTTEAIKFIRSRGPSSQMMNSGNLYDTSNVIEGKYIDLLGKEEIIGSKTLWAIGPFNPVVISDNKNSSERGKVLEWLDKQEVNSVIYVSFGTTTSFTDEQIQELAIGLEDSGQKFVWVLRDADRGDIFEGEHRRVELPKGYEERVEGKGVGMVVREWAPQLEILGHPSTGGFVSHCGWNSCMESLTMGVPIAAWPMHSDQPRNAMLITNLLKVGIYVRDWANRDELVTSLTIEQAVRGLMTSNEGDEMRKKADELGGAVRRSVEEGGVMRKELDSFIAHITR